MEDSVLLVGNGLNNVGRQYKSYSNRIQSKLDLLRSVDVDTFPVELRGDDWKAYYFSVLERIKNLRMNQLAMRN